MINDWMAAQGIVVAPAAVLLLFFLLFLCLLAWLYRPGSEERYQLEANLPFDDGQVNHPSEPTIQGEGHGHRNQ